MSLLEEIATKKKSLKPTETKVTTADGFQYVETSSHCSSGRPPNLVIQRPSCSGYVVDDKPDLHIGEITDNLMIGKLDTGLFQKSLPFSSMSFSLDYCYYGLIYRYCCMHIGYNTRMMTPNKYCYCILIVSCANL